MLFLYKYIDITEYDLLVQEIINIIDIDTMTKTNLTFFQLKCHEWLPKFTRLHDFVKSQNLNVIKTVIVRAQPGFHKDNIHIDNCNAKTFDELKYNYVHDSLESTRDVLGLQIGLTNIENTYTGLFRYVSGEIKKQDSIFSTNFPIKQNYPNMKFEKCLMEEIGRYTATRPVIFNATVPHTVVNNTDQPRLLLTLRFDPDPWHLTE
jgi:hypothetical protein